MTKPTQRQTKAQLEKRLIGALKTNVRLRRDIECFERERRTDRQALHLYYSGYGQSQRKVEELTGVVGILSDFQRDPELPSAWELACAFNDSFWQSHP